MDLSGGESLDDYHGAATLGTQPVWTWIWGRGYCRFGWHCCGVEGCKAQWQKLSSLATGEETEMPDADKALGEQMQEEAA